MPKKSILTQVEIPACGRLLSSKEVEEASEKLFDFLSYEIPARVLFATLKKFNGDSSGMIHVTINGKD